jgi:large subunit ribosomal protein L24
VKLKIKKGDTVEMIAGADRGKKGQVLEIDKQKLRILVQGVRVQTKHDKKEGLVKREGYVDYSNVKLVEAAAKKAKTRKKASKAASN